MDFNKLNRGDLNNLQNQDLDFDKEAMWANLENRKEKRPVFWWSLIGSGIILFLLISVSFFFGNENVINNDSQVIDNQFIESFESESEISNDDSIIESTEQNIVHPTSKKEKKSLSNNSLKKKPENGLEQSNESNSNLTLEQIANVRKNINFVNPTAQLNNIKLENSSNQAIQNSRETESINLEQLDLAEPIGLKQAFLKIEKIEEFNLPKPVLPKVNKAKTLDFAITSFAGIGYQFQNIESKADDLNSNYLNSRLANEKQFESWTLGLLIDKTISKNLMLGTGIEFIQHNEQLMIIESETNNVEKFSEEEVPSQLIGREGFLTKNVSTIYQNQYRLINVPLSVSWMLNSKKVRFAPTASLVFNLSQNAKGHIQNEESVIEELQPYFKSNIGLAYRLGCRVYYPFSSRFVFFANPQFEINSNDVSQSINPLLQKRNMVRLDIGVSTQIGF